MKKCVLFVSSTGGHLSELLQLKSLFEKVDYHIITEKTKSNLALKKKYPSRVNFLIYGTKDHMLTYPVKLFLNCLKSLYFYFMPIFWNHSPHTQLRQKTCTQKKHYVILILCISCFNSYR